MPVLPHTQTLAARISPSDIFVIIVQMSDFMLSHLLRVPTSKYKHQQLWWNPQAHTDSPHYLIPIILPRTYQIVL